MRKKIINSFPGYEFIPSSPKHPKGQNMFRGVDLKFGGYVYSEPGIYTDVALLDVNSLHPNSAVNMNYFGDYTQRFKDILDARLAIKHREFDKVRKMFDGKLEKYLTDESLADQLSQALKICVNSVYGLSSASFDNPFRDKRNINNIIALRGALFMKTLQDEVVKQGFTVAHIKTDSIKIPNATKEIIKFCFDFAEKYGYVFEHEATYDRMCLIDKAQYVAAYLRPEECQAKYGYIPSANAKHFKKHNYPWTTTGDEFQRAYIFKTLFSGEPIVFDDLCVTNSVQTGTIYLDMNEKLPNVDIPEKEWERRQNNLKHPDKPMRLNPDYKDISDEEVMNEIAEGHDYHFVGRVGRFCPIKKNAGGGLLMVYRKEKYDSVSGSKGYRWLEAEMVQALHKEDDVDISYHEKQASDAVDEVNKLGSFDRFIDLSKPYIFESASDSTDEDDEVPWDTLPPVVPCGDGKYNSCLECPRCDGDLCRSGYSLSVN